MRKLIDKETMLKSVSDIKAEWGNDNLSLINQAEVLDLIEEQPTVDAVQVVRCKHCIRNKWCCISIRENGRFPTDYCSYGKRKDGAEHEQADRTHQQKRFI